MGAPHAFGLLVERVGHVVMNDTLLVATEPRRNRVHLFDLRNDGPIGAFGDGYPDARRLRSPRRRLRPDADRAAPRAADNAAPPLRRACTRCATR